METEFSFCPASQIKTVLDLKDFSAILRNDYEIQTELPNIVKKVGRSYDKLLYDLDRLGLFLSPLLLVEAFNEVRGCKLSSSIF